MATSSANAQKVSRKLKYKELIEKGAKVGEVLENQHVLDSFKNIMEIIDICENVSTDYAKEAKIEHTAEYLMDASVIKMSHDLMGSMTEKISNSDFREDEYITSLLQIMKSNENKLVDIAIGCNRSVKFELSLLGTFNFDAKARPQVAKKERQRTKKTLGPKEAPENIKQIVKVDKGAEKINIMRSEIQRICQQRNSKYISYYEVITNPNNFMKSIDAAFQISFLVRDGILGIKRIDNEPCIYIQDSQTSISASRSQQNLPEDTVQAVMSLDPKTWREQIKKYKLKAPLLRLDSENEEIIDTSDSD